jgi:RNase H-like domain found in reverse transcriptase
MSEIYIEAARQQVRVVCNHDEFSLRKVVHQGWSTFRPKEYGSAANNARAVEWCDLVQYVAAVNWMRSAIPNYSNRVAPLQAALAKVFEGKNRRTKKAAAAVSLLHLWGPEEQAAFKYLQAAIMESMTLAFPDPDKRICVLTDASYRLYAGLLTQIHKEQLDLPMKEQYHQHLAFLSGEFKRAQRRWTVAEKEFLPLPIQLPRWTTFCLVMVSSRFCLNISTSHTFTILSLQALLSRAMLYTSCNTGHSICPCSLISWSTLWASSSTGQTS